MCNCKGNAVRGRLNAWFFRTFDRYLNSFTEERKKRLFENVSGVVAEIGPGTGANFRFLKPATRVYGIEPNPHMIPALTSTAETLGIQLEVIQSGAELIPLPDNSVDHVIGTLVLCTVENPCAVLREIRRVLKPGGSYAFVEHIADEAGGMRRRLQNLFHGIWHYLFEGCHTNRQTGRLIQAGRFSQVDTEYFTLKSPFYLVNTQVCGVAVK
jgi:ubiquinone/menaquinone biosynthesis C-methylase UbiE